MSIILQSKAAHFVCDLNQNTAVFKTTFGGLPHCTSDKHHDRFHHTHIQTCRIFTLLTLFTKYHCN